eukprot:4418739-Amphidinium_carterae.1
MPRTDWRRQGLRKKENTIVIIIGRTVTKHVCNKPSSIEAAEESSHSTCLTPSFSTTTSSNAGNGYELNGKVQIDGLKRVAHACTVGSPYRIAKKRIISTLQLYTT